MQATLLSTYQRDCNNHIGHTRSSSSLELCHSRQFRESERGIEDAYVIERDEERNIEGVRGIDRMRERKRGYLCFERYLDSNNKRQI